MLFRTVYLEGRSTKNLHTNTQHARTPDKELNFKYLGSSGLTGGGGGSPPRAPRFGGPQRPLLPEIMRWKKFGSKSFSQNKNYIATSCCPRLHPCNKFLQRIHRNVRIFFCLRNTYRYIKDNTHILLDL